MPGVVREGDVSTSHCFNPTPPASYSSSVTCNNRGVVRNGDSIVIHCCGPVCHVGQYVANHSVSLDGRSIILKGDSIDCGDTTNACSSNVTACG